MGNPGDCRIPLRTGICGRYLHYSGFILINVLMLFFLNLCAVVFSADEPFKKGEVLEYNIKKFGITIGEASITYGGIVEVHGQRAHLITVFAESFNFYDKDRIYLAEDTFQPIVVKRDLKIFGKQELINEYYDKSSGKVRIVKEVSGKKSEQVIENGATFDHIYGFIYRQRQLGLISEDRVIELHLPTRDVRFEKIIKKTIKVEGKKYDALFMGSVPKKFSVFFDADNGMIPLRINGALGVGNMSMVFKGRRVKEN